MGRNGEYSGFDSRMVHHKAYSTALHGYLNRAIEFTLRGVIDLKLLLMSMFYNGPSWYASGALVGFDSPPIHQVSKESVLQI